MHGLECRLFFKVEMLFWLISFKVEIGDQGSEGVGIQVAGIHTM